MCGSYRTDIFEIHPPYYTEIPMAVSYELRMLENASITAKEGSNN